MKQIFTLFAAMVCASASSQLYVSPNSYMYVNDQIVYVKQNINLQNNGNIYLRREAQLLQGTTGSSTNQGAGKLSVYQEGTSDNFDYNYWCSPVGNATASSGNESFGIGMLGVPTSTTATTPASVIGGLDGTAVPFSVSSAWIYKFINSDNYSQWVFVGSANNIAPGQGFTMKGTSGVDPTVVDGVQNNPGGAQRYDFRGKPNDGNISVNVGADQLTLTGNPYPSALHVNAFLLDPSNAACTGIAYYWEQNKSVNSHYLQQYQGGYGTYSPISVGSNGVYVPATFDTYDGSGNLNATGTSSGLVIERKYAPIGQGFMIKGLSNGSVTLKNSHREYYKESGALSRFERMASSSQMPPDETGAVPQIRLNAILNNQFTRQVALVFVPEATDGVDRGIDALSPAGDDLPNDVYFVLDGGKYVIQGVNFDVNRRIPIGIKSAANSTFRFYIPETIAFNPNQQVYIYDAADGSYHNIRTGTYDVTLEAGTWENRFQVTFLDGSLDIAVHQQHGIDIIQNNNSRILSVVNPNGKFLEECSVFDMAGKRLISEKSPAQMESIPTADWSDGVYVARVKYDGGEFSKKIVVSRRY